MPPAMLKITNVMFCAHDDKETVVYFSDIQSKWVLGNNLGFCATYDVMQRALGDMYAITGIDQNNWTIIEQ